jgi:hypothetical protein
MRSATTADDGTPSPFRGRVGERVGERESTSERRKDRVVSLTRPLAELSLKGEVIHFGAKPFIS